MAPAQSEPALDERAASRDHLLTESATLARRGTFRVHGTAIGGTFAPTSTHSTLGFAPIGGVYGFVGARTFDGRIAPSAGARVRVLDQANNALDVTIGSAVRAWSATEEKGAQTELRVAIGRRFGGLSAIVNVAIAQGFAGRDDTDAEASSALTYAVTDAVRFGGEGRVRFEVADRDIPNEGREYEATAGATAT